jgi:hypothetical protein
MRGFYTQRRRDGGVVSADGAAVSMRSRVPAGWLQKLAPGPGSVSQAMRFGMFQLSQALECDSVAAGAPFHYFGADPVRPSRILVLE